MLSTLLLPACNEAKRDGATAPAAGQLRADSNSPSPTSYVQTEFSVQGMHCEDCTAAISGKLTKLPGVVGVNADYKQGLVKVMYDPRRAQQMQLQQAIEALKFKVSGATQPKPVGASAASNEGQPHVVAVKGVAGDKKTEIRLPPMGRKMPDGSQQLRYNVQGIKDSTIEVKITKGVASLKGVYHVHASHVTGAVVVDFDPTQIDAPQIEAKLRELGFEPTAAAGKRTK